MPRFTLSLLMPALLASAWAAPVTIQTDGGPLTLSAPASRVVPLEYSFLDTLIALGLRPVAAATGNQGGDRGVPAYLRARVQGLTVAGSRAQPSFEIIAASRPQLILADSFVHKSILGNLARLAPTAAFSSRRGSYADIMSQVSLIGHPVGRDSLAKQIVDDQARLVLKAKAFANPKAPPLVAAVAVPDSLTLHSTESFVGAFLGQLGRPDKVTPQGGQSQFETSLEGLVALAPHTLVVFTGADETPITRGWMQSPLWKSIPAVQRGRVYMFDRDLWTRARGPIALKLMVAQAIESGLLADKPPTTGYALQ